MKSAFKKIGMLTAFVFAFLPVSAYDFTVDGIYYNVVSLSDLTCEVAKGDEEYAGDITIPEKVTYKNKELTVTSIGNYAFEYCSGLTSITMGNSVTSIGNYAFENCSALSSITIGSSVTSIGLRAFENCSVLSSITIGSSVTRIGNCAFLGCSGLKKVIIEDGIEPLSLGYNSYSYYEDGEGLFYDCPLTTLYLGRDISVNENVSGNSRNYGYSPFRGKYNLTEVTIGNSVTRIGYSVFRDCGGLTSITIPNSVKSIGEYVFSGCSSLASIYSLNPIPPTIGGSNFTNKQYMDMKVYVPQGSLSAYQSADRWKDFWELQEFDPTGVETIKADGKNIKDSYYDIQGRKLNAPKKGLNIINGKKVLIKE